MNTTGKVYNPTMDVDDNICTPLLTVVRYVLGMCTSGYVMCMVHTVYAPFHCDVVYYTNDVTHQTETT